MRTSKVMLWFLVTSGEGIKIFWRLGRFLIHRDDATAELLSCQDGHPVPAYGRWECQCGVVFTGWVFAACPNCGSIAGWTPCHCGAPVFNPLR